MIHIANNIRSIPFTPALKITLTDGTDIDVAANGLGANSEFVDAAECSTLPIGHCIGRIARLELYNRQNRFDSIDFFGASIVLTLTYSSGETITISDLTVQNEPDCRGRIIELVCVNSAWRTDVAYESQLTFPASVGAVWREICTICGLTSDTVSHVVFSQTITSAPVGLTCREVLGHIAGMAGGNAVFTPSGHVMIKEIYIPDADTDTSQHDVHVLDHWKTLTPAVAPITITGVELTYTDDATVLAGTAGYVLQIRNPLVNADDAASIAANILAIVGRAPIRPFEGLSFFYPIAEFGDACAVVEADETVFYSVMSSVSWGIGAPTAMRCVMDAPARSGARYADPSLRALIEARRLVTAERTAREQAIISLQTAISSASGMYKTEEEQSDHSVIYYLHDKPALSASSNVIKLTAEAIGFSTDGGQTWPYGFHITGDIVTRLLSAAGVDAGWITTGALTVRDANNKILFQADITNRTVYIAGISVINGTVTIGEQGEQYHAEIGRDGLAIYAHGQQVAYMGATDSTLPTHTVIPTSGHLSIGEYKLYPVGDGFAMGL